MATPKSVAFHTLGCKLNFSESSAIKRQFEEAGYACVPFEEQSDVYVINTCSVTDFADRKCRAAVRKAMRNNPGGQVVVTGCYAQLKPKEISEIEGVDLVLGAAEKFKILDFIDQLVRSEERRRLVEAGNIFSVESFESAYSFGDRTRSFLKIQDGCDYKCSFCTIPQARGRSRSDSIENIKGKVREIAARGVKEVVLTGVNIGDFGLSMNGEGFKRKETFLDLIQELDQMEEIARFRISSIEPNLCH